jgi:hypothetical protein
MRAGAALTLATLLLLAGAPVRAFHDEFGDTYQLRLGDFTLVGRYRAGSCALQGSFRSLRGAHTTFTVYWLPGRSLHLATHHPEVARVNGRQTMQFRFPDGTAMAFATTRNGNQLQTRIGFGAAAQRFYEAIERNPSMRIELPAVGDAVNVSLEKREEAVAAMFHCRDDYLHRR